MVIGVFLELQRAIWICDMEYRISESLECDGGRRLTFKRDRMLTSPLANACCTDRASDDLERTILVTRGSNLKKWKVNVEGQIRFDQCGLALLANQRMSGRRVIGTHLHLHRIPAETAITHSASCGFL